MNSSSLPVPSAGIIPPMITPLAARDRLDHEGIDALVEHILTADIAGLFLLGTCGEGPALPFKLQTELVERVCSQVNDRVPILIGISNPSIDDAIGLAEHAAECGVSGVVSTLPYYFPLPDEQRLNHLVRLAQRSPLPLIVYNMPSCVHATITVEMLQRLSEEPNVAGFKDSASDMQAFASYCKFAIQHRPDWCRLVGPEHLLPEAISLGGTGGVHGGANVCPTLFCNLYQAAVDEDQAALNRYCKQADVLGRLYGQPRNVSSIIRGLKMSLALLGICKHHTTDLFAPPSNDQWKTAESVIAQLATWGLVPA